MDINSRINRSLAKDSVHRILTAAMIAVLMLVSPAAMSTPVRVLVLGDSWAGPVVPQLNTVFRENGYTDVSVVGFSNKGAAAQMSSQDGLDYVSQMLATFSDTTIVHLSLGAHDFLASGWTLAWSSQEETDLLQGIINDVEVVIDHIFSLRPDIEIIWSGYDFPRPLARGTAPPGVNNFMLKMAEKKAQFALTKPGVSVVDFYGTLQVTYGFDGVQHSEFDPDFVIPPGDPSLPNPDFPSPLEAFLPNDPMHPNPGGNKAVAQAQYDLFYGPLLKQEAFQINPGLNGSWANFDTLGQGFFIDVLPDIPLIFFAWFTWETNQAATAQKGGEMLQAVVGDDNHRWMTAQGSFAGNTAQLDVTLTTGGLFDDPTPVTNSPEGSQGTITLTFTDCENGVADYKFTAAGVSGRVPFRRLSDDNVALCQSMDGIDDPE